MNYFIIGSDGGGCCNFIQYQGCPIGYSDGAPFISADRYKMPQKIDTRNEELKQNKADSEKSEPANN